MTVVRAAHRAAAAGDLREAASLWAEVVGQAPDDPSAWLNLAACRRAIGQGAEALQAVDRALGLEPHNFTALLLRASLLEREGRSREAASAYALAQAAAPPEHALDLPTRRALEHGRTVSAEHAEAFEAFLRERIGVRAGTQSGDRRRVSAFVDLIAGRRARYRQEPMGFYYPDMPAIEFWDREEFPWMEELEAQTDAIRSELAQVMGEDAPDFEPYVNYPDDAPLEQWVELNRSRRWSGYHLLAEGRRIEPHCAACPRTMEALSATPQPQVPGRSPAAMFSMLEPGTHIPPHTGVSNTRLVCHLPLVVPEGCRFRVGAETRRYADRRAWVFDDTIEHEAWNEGAGPRAILLFDVWNPRLSLWEREMISTLTAAVDAFNGESGRGASGFSAEPAPQAMSAGVG